ncbi:MAG: hypothetical protein K9L61_01855 [Candidatus Omnitrophica bacterium]|nr:hypothetical protein [Candidatus Omnitrophota bacterium]
MTEHIKTIIDKYIEQNKKKQNQYSTIKNILKEELNQKIIEKTQIEFKSKKEIIIYLSSSIAAYEFRLKKEKIMEEIKRKIPVIKKVKIEVK